MRNPGTITQLLKMNEQRLEIRVQYKQTLPGLAFSDLYL